MGLPENLNFKCIAFRNPVLNFINFLNSRALLSYKPLSYKKKTRVTRGQSLSCPWLLSLISNSSCRHFAIFS